MAKNGRNTRPNPADEPIAPKLAAASIASLQAWAATTSQIPSNNDSAQNSRSDDARLHGHVENEPTAYTNTDFNHADRKRARDTEWAGPAEREAKRLKNNDQGKSAGGGEGGLDRSSHGNEYAYDDSSEWSFPSDDESTTKKGAT